MEFDFEEIKFWLEFKSQYFKEDDSSVAEGHPMIA